MFRFIGVLCPTTNYSHMETGSQFKVSSKGPVDWGIEPTISGLQGVTIPLNHGRSSYGNSSSCLKQSQCLNETKLLGLKKDFLSYRKINKQNMLKYKSLLLKALEEI